MSLETGSENRILMSTDDLPERERNEVARDFFGRISMRLDLAPEDGGKLRLETSTLCLPDITTSFGTVNPMSWHRTGELLADGNDDLCISWMAGKYLLARPGHEDVEAAPGAGCLTSLDQRWRGTTLDGSWMMCVHFKRSALERLVEDVDGIVPGCVEPARPESRLLFDYLRSIHAIPNAGHHGPMFASHLTDLLALALGANRDGQEQARLGGARAARLLAVKRYVCKHLASSRLSAESAGKALNLSSRYVRSLFADQGTTFSDYVTERRLRLAFEALQCRDQEKTVADIALAVGFAEPSTFYRLFKARYQMTPGDVRVH